MKTFLNILYEVFCVLGCLLGAGFISGAEVQTFFVDFGWYGLIGIILSSIIFILTICKSKNSINSTSNTRFNFLPYCQLFIAGAMLTGMASVVSNMLNTSYYLILFVIGLLLFVATVFGIKFANFFNVIVSALTIIILPIVVNSVNTTMPQINTNFKLFSAIVYSALYSVINIVACMPVINALSKKHSKIVGIASGIITCALLCVIYIILSNNYVNADMPILALINNKYLKLVYIVLLVVAMISTLFSTSSGVKQIFAKIKNNILESLCSCFAIVSISFVGFGWIIKYIYPVIGIAFFIQVILNKLYKQPKKSQYITK